MKLKMVDQKTEELKLSGWNKILISALVVLLITGCTYDRDLFHKPKNVSAKTLNAGPTSSLVRSSRKERKSPSGIYDVKSSYRIKYTSDTIVAKKGAQFGIEFILLATTKGKVKIKAVWTFPEPIVNENGKVFKSYTFKDSRFTHERRYLEFVLKEEYMVVKGPWKLELFHKRNKILEKVFHLI